MVDKTTETLVEALRQALSEPAEQRLFRSGKLPGLFPGRGGPSAEAATRALHQGLLEVVRTEAKGKTTTEWVRLTPHGVDFLHRHESPTRVLEELRDVLQTSREGVPLWLARMRQELETLTARLTEDARRWTQRLEALSQRVDEALRRADAGSSQVPDGMAPIVPWALEALAYLDRRRDGGMPGHCPLPELFAAVRRQHADLSIKGFHDGLRRLDDRRALQLLPFTGPSQELPEPEFALLDGPAVLYYVTR
ncbi:MAG TPA: hypothetical protein VG013_10785 [Gemmataceae bacterium]|jgi:hypothetical protein|nr:hypothetical protein [Gemmataceae bacterium]